MWFNKSRGAVSIGFFAILFCAALPITSKAGHALLIAYPDSKITVVDKGTDSRLELGHAGILLISDSGVTGYYEFGRYDNTKKGKIRKVTLPNIRSSRPGVVEEESVLKVLKKLSDFSGQRGRILAAYVPGVNYNAMYQFIEKSKKEWPDYHWYSNNCATYANAVLRAGKPPKAPFVTNAITTPELIVRDYLLAGNGEVRYDPNKGTFCFRPPGNLWDALFNKNCKKITSR